MRNDCCHDSRHHDLKTGRCGICKRPLWNVHYEDPAGPARMLGNLLLGAIVALAIGIIVVVCVRPAQGQSIPTTQPISDLVTFRSMEAAGTVVLVQQRTNPSFLSTRDHWYEAVWYDSFVWKPGYAVTAVYGWECRYLTQDGRWLVLHRHGSKPRIQSAYSLMQNARQIGLIQADLTRDGKLDQADYGVLQTQLGRFGPLSGDLNKDGCVDSADFELFDLTRQAFGR